MGQSSGTEDRKAHLLADYRAVTPGYFQAIGAQLLAGRYFNKHDDATGHKVLIVDSMLARQIWPGKDALGKRLNVERYTDDGFATDWAEIVGVIEHIKGQSLLKSIRSQIYIPYPQSAREHLSFVVSSSQDPSALAPAVRNEISRIDKTRAIAKVRPMDDYISTAMAPTKFSDNTCCFDCCMLAAGTPSGVGKSSRYFAELNSLRCQTERRSFQEGAHFNV
jgi:hypothetical protein